MAILGLVAILLAGLLPGAARAQSPWRAEHNYFTITLPAGWRVQAPKVGSWILVGEDVERNGTCIVSQNATASLPFAQSALDEAVRNPEYLNREIAAFLRLWQGAVPRVIEIAAPTAAPHVRIQLIADAARGRMALDALLTWRPGSLWLVMCRIGAEHMQAGARQLDQIVTSFRTGETYGATNR
jgi:hypothetical protein